MENGFQIQIQTARVKNIPFQNYIKDFTFIVNDEEIQTSQIVADLLSPKICKIHLCDPTFNRYPIETNQKGHFQYFIDLINFERNEIPRTELQFINEIIEDLGNESIDFYDKTVDLEITNSTVLQNINIHLQNRFFYQKQIQKEIDYVSSHFWEICENQTSELLEMPIIILEDIIKNCNLKLKSEDQLLLFIIKLYESKPECSFLFEYIDFVNTTSNAISDFISIFSIDDFTHKIWEQLSNRLKQKIIKDREHQNENHHLMEQSIFLPFERNKEFNGIINFLQEHSNGRISDEIEVKSFTKNTDENIPMNVLLFDDPDSYFFSDEGEHPWLCFDFKKNRINPTNYTIRKNADYCHPKSWVIEASNDEENWVVLDEEVDNEYLENDISHTYSIENKSNDNFRFIRFKMTNCNSSGRSNCIIIDSFEFYGKLIYW